MWRLAAPPTGSPPYNPLTLPLFQGPAVTVVHPTDANFQAEVRDAASPVLVDVWAEWCGPCRLMAPMMDAMAAEYVGRLTVGKLEADPNPITRDGLQIQGLPTLILFRDGQELARHEGAMAKPQLKAFVDAHL